MTDVEYAKYSVENKYEVSKTFDELYKTRKKMKTQLNNFLYLTFDMHSKFEERKLFFIPIDNLISIPIQLFINSIIIAHREKFDLEKKIR